MVKDKIIFVIGNGFDIDLGLNTSFKSFIDSNDFISIADIPIIVKIRENKDDALWCDIEGIIRKSLICNDSNNEDINYAWQAITRHWEHYIQDATRKEIITINEKSCAYMILKQMSPLITWYSFNYTSPFYLTNLGNIEPIYVHNKFLPIECTNGIHILIKEAIIGVDSNLPDNILNNNKISHIIKRNNPFYKETYITNKLVEAEYVIVFGHSLGITDSGYFKPLFKDILNSRVKSKYIYIITYDNNSLNDIKLHLKEYDIDYNELCKKSYLKTVFTSEGANNTEFKEVLELLKS